MRKRREKTKRVIIKGGREGGGEELLIIFTSRGGSIGRKEQKAKTPFGGANAAQRGGMGKEFLHFWGTREKQKRKKRGK